MVLIGEIKDDEMGEYVARTGKIECVRNLCLKAEGKRPLVRPRRRWKYTIKIYIL
jgi:hypothetical protein